MENQEFENAFSAARKTIKIEKISVDTTDKNELHKIIDECQPDDKLVIWLEDNTIGAKYFSYVFIKKRIE